MDALYTILDTLTAWMGLVAIVGCLGQVFLSMQKRWFWGCVLPAISFAIVLYWAQNPLPSWRIDTPNMTAMNVILWFPFTVLLAIIYGICRVVCYHKNKEYSHLD